MVVCVDVGCCVFILKELNAAEGAVWFRDALD